MLLVRISSIRLVNWAWKWQCDDAGNEYKGTILEHLLLQNMTSFYEVGEHNHIRLRDADWNDAIDMASKRGESVAFTNAYAMNLDTLADILEYEKEHGVQYVMLLEEMCKLIGVDKAVYDSIESKVKLLDEYMEACTHIISGKKVKVDIDELEIYYEKGFGLFAVETNAVDSFANIASPYSGELYEPWVFE